MMTLDELRQSLGRPGLTDEEAATVRDFLYGLANMLVDDYVAGKGVPPPHKR